MDPKGNSIHNDHQLQSENVKGVGIPVFIVANTKKNIASRRLRQATFIAIAVPSVSKINPSRG